MALSEEEQRLLDQLEASLAADDPGLAQKFGTAARPRPSAGRLALSGIAFVIGLAGLVGGIPLGWVLSVVGFVIMFAAVAALLLSPAAKPAEPDKPAKTPAAAGTGGFMDRLGERWNQRHE